MSSGAWTAVGTIILAAVTLAAIVTTILITKQDRQRSDKQLHDEQGRHDQEIAEERRLADERLAKQLAHSDDQLDKERAHSAAQLRGERHHAEEVRRRERQAENARVLIQRIAGLQPHYGAIADTSDIYVHDSPSRLAKEAAIESLEHGALAEVPLLGGGEAAQTAADRYRQLVQLIRSADHRDDLDERRTIGTLRNYGRWVRISLRMLAEEQTVPPIHGGSAEYPLLGLPDHMPLWQPNPIPPGWNEEADAETGR